MKMNRIKQEIIPEMPWKTKISMQESKLLTVLMILVIFILSLGITQQTLGTFMRSFVVTDSASAAGFDVIITAPEEFWPGQGESDFEYHFLSDIDIQGFVFQITNNGKVDIFCKPYIDSNITYRIYVDGEVVTGFAVAANETVGFGLIISPDGLDTNVTSAKLFVDIQQTEGRQLLWKN